jgi:3-phosphoshikimate 1-carboxyvinyltransferase
MAMCFAILGLKVAGVSLKNPSCVKKTFPNYFQKLAAPPPVGLGAGILDAMSGRALRDAELFAEGESHVAADNQSTGRNCH